MVDRGREFGRNDEPERRNSEGESNPARREHLRFTGTNPDIWQDLQRRTREHRSFHEETENLPNDERRARLLVWADSIPQEYRAEAIMTIIGAERPRLFRETRNLPIAEQRLRHQAWVDSWANTFPEELIPQDNRGRMIESLIDREREFLLNDPSPDQQQAIEWANSLPQPYQRRERVTLGLDRQIQPIPQQLLESFRQEEYNRQQHYERVQTIIHEQQLGIEIPDQSTQEWSNFAADLITAHEDLHGLGTSGVLGDILQGGIRKEASWNDEVRNSKEYKDLMTWVLRRWKAREQYRKIEQTFIQKEHLDIQIPNRSTQEWPNFATNLMRVYKKYLHGPGSSRALEDILEGGIHEEASWNEIRNSKEYEDLMSWVLRNWRDRKNV